MKIIDIDLQRRRISLSIKQAAEGGEVAEEYREAFGEHAYDAEGNYIGYDYSATDFTPETESQAAWADLLAAKEAASATAAEQSAGSPVVGEPVTGLEGAAEAAEAELSEQSTAEAQVAGGDSPEVTESLPEETSAPEAITEPEVPMDPYYEAPKG